MVIVERTGSSQLLEDSLASPIIYCCKIPCIGIVWAFIFRIRINKTTLERHLGNDRWDGLSLIRPNRMAAGLIHINPCDPGVSGRAVLGGLDINISKVVFDDDRLIGGY